MMWIATPQDAPAFAADASPWLVDEFIESYVCWRESAATVKDAYEHWRDLHGKDRALAFAAYQAALDGEELAARAHRECTERIAGRAR
jgi:hypothetical protein